MKYINSKWLALILLGLLFVLASFAWARYVYQEPLVTVWANPEAQKLAFVYNVEIDDVPQASVIWGDKK